MSDVLDFYGLKTPTGSTLSDFGGTFNNQASVLPTIPGAAPTSAGLAGLLGQNGNSDALGLGMNMGTAKLGLNGLMGLASLWTALQGNKLAREQFDFTKSTTNTNLNNQIQSYNTALEDRSRSRAAVEGQSTAASEDYINRNRLTR